MPLIELLDDDEISLIETLSNPCLFAEFINNFDYDPEQPYGKEVFELTTYQKDLLMDFSNYVSFRGGRSVGKTESLKWLFLWIMVYNVFPDDYALFTCPGRAHLEPVFTAVTRAFRTNSFLAQFIAPKSGINNSDYTVTLLNQAKLLCRIAGPYGDGRAVNGLHTPFEVLDEFGYYNFNTYLELIPTLNTWTPGHKRVVAGVPSGLREKNTGWMCDQVDSSYSKHRVSALQNPRFSEDDHQRAIEQYGGVDSDDYKRMVLGEHGAAVTALFDRSQMIISDYPVYKIKIDGKEVKENIGKSLERLSVIPSLPNKKFNCFFGVDLGYNDPTAIYILYFDEYSTVKFHAKIEFAQVTFPVQERLLDYLDTKYSPLFIGIDRGSGGQGISFTQHFFEDNTYQHKEYTKRMIPITFNENISLGIGPDGKELVSKVKPFSVEILQSMVTQGHLVFTSTDLETITELERMTYTKTPSGEIIYRTLTEGGGKQGSDHYTAALLCAVMAKWIVNDSIKNKPKKKLLTPKWFMGGR